MGVRGLQTFLEHCCPQGACEINIKDIAEAYRRETNRKIVIVVDGPSCLRHIYGNLDWICGGQLREFVEIFKSFIEAFTQLDIELVFFFDGPTQARKRKVWVDRRLRSLNDVNRIFDIIERGTANPFHIPQSLFQLPTGTGYLASFAIENSPGCKLHRSIKECDEEIAEYARHHNCFAILGQDSDYVIYDGPQYYLSASHLNVLKMTTINYNRWALARQLHLTPGLLPLLATLVGNDLVPSEDLMDFHRKICWQRNNSRLNTKDVIYSVARFIQKFANENNLYEALPTISKAVFGNEERASQLHLSVRSYSLNPLPVTCQKEESLLKLESSDCEVHWKNIQRYAESIFVIGQLDTMVYAVIHGLPYESCTGVEDFRRRDLPASALAYRPLRQRIYGLVLHEKPGDAKNCYVEEWSMQGIESLKETVKVPVAPPDSDIHPGLLKLWNTEDTTEVTKSKKWSLVAHAVSSKLEPAKLRTLPAPLLAPTALLYYLCHEVTPPFLQTWEIEAFIAQAVLLPTLDTAYLSHIEITSLNSRAVQLGCIFMRGIPTFKMLMSACGHPVPPSQVSAWYCFDGKLFHSTYLKAQSGCKRMDLCNSQVEILQLFNLIRAIILPDDE